MIALGLFLSSSMTGCHSVGEDFNGTWILPDSTIIIKGTEATVYNKNNTATEMGSIKIIDDKNADLSVSLLFTLTGRLTLTDKNSMTIVTPGPFNTNTEYAHRK